VRHPLAAAALAVAVVAATPPLLASAAPTAVPAVGPAVGVRVLVTLDDGVRDVPAAARAAVPAGSRVERSWSAVLKGFSATVPAPALPALQRAPGVRRVEPDVVLRTSAVQPSPPAGLDRVDQRSQPLSGSYSFNRTGAGVTAYVVDTGIRRSHSDFGGRARTGFDAVTSGGAADDCDGHGTHVAGTVGGTRFGVAKEVALSAVRVLGCDGSGTGSALLAGLDFVVRDHRAGSPAVAVLSLGGETTSSTIDDAVRRVVADGVTVAVAAGNSAVDACTVSPARVPDVLTVGATSPSTDVRAPFSNTGSCLDLFAPGVSILSAGHTSDTATLVSSGTSMAAPHVAGAAALVLQGAPSATPADVTRRLLDAATTGVVTDARSPANLLLFTDPIADAPSLTLPAPSPSPSPSASPTAEPLVPALPADTDDVRGRFTPLEPARVLDTRDGTGGISGRLAPGRPVELQVTGRGGVPPTGVTAVALNVTVTGPAAAGHLTAYPAGRAAPVASNLNHVAGQTVANLVATGVSDAGRVALLSNAGTPHVVADVVGYWSDTLGGSRSTPVTPARLLDTRSGLGGTAGRLDPGSVVSLQVSGRGGVPGGATAAVVNVTAVGPTASGHLTAFPGDSATPDASTLNYATGATVPNLAIVGLGPNGDLQLRSNAGSPHVVVDVVGWYGEQGSSRFVPVEPERLLDTRAGTGRLAPGEELVLDVSRSAQLPGLGVRSVLVNVTAVGPSAAGHLTVFPADARLPVASNVNYVRGQTVPNLVLSGTAVEGGAIRIRSNAGSPHVLVDVVGYTTETTSSLP
jgi:subtilisin family serine protease